jgi:hypothetical protein
VNTAVPNFQQGPIGTKLQGSKFWFNFYYFNDPISPDETGLTNSLAAAVLQRPLLIQGKHSISCKKKVTIISKENCANRKNITYLQKKAEKNA